MSGAGFGVWGGRGLSWVVVLSLGTLARAQSTASFPTAATPVAEPAASAAVAAAPVVSAAPPAASSAANPTTASRYPVLPAAAPAPSSAALPFYPALLPYRAGLRVPAGYRVEHRTANGLIVGGLGSLVLAYGASLAVAASDGFDNGTGWLLLPVAGPWAAIGARTYHCDNNPAHANACVSGAFNEVQTIALLSADAVVQATGAVLFLAGLGSGRDELVRTDLEAGAHVTPRAVGNSGFGFGVEGRF